MQSLPEARGDASSVLVEHLTDDVHELPRVAVDRVDALVDDDLQLALYLCYELHYRGLPGVDERWEWDPALLGWRGRRSPGGVARWRSGDWAATRSSRRPPGARRSRRAGGAAGRASTSD